MKKLLLLMLAAIMLMSILAGCGTWAADTDPVGRLSEEQMAVMEEMGIPMDEFNQMSAEEQQALLDELGIVADYMEQENQDDTPRPSSKKYTTADIAAGGKYKVRIGDGLWNNYWLYYEDGKLVKVEISFQKSSEEEPETYLFEGDTLSDFWYYDKSLDELIAYFDQQNYGYTHSITPID